MFLAFVFEAFEYHLLSRFRSLEATRIATHTFGPGQSKRVLIYVGFDKESILRDTVLKQLEAFRKLDYEIIYVSTSPAIRPLDLDRLKGICQKVIHRRNSGYDFCSWRLGFESIQGQFRDLESLILMNDSCEGPHFDIEPMVARMVSETEAVYGITMSLEIDEYLQSYFFHFGAKTLHAGIVDRFMERIRILHSKWCIVRYLEIGSSRFLKSQGVPLKAWVDPSDPTIAQVMERYSQTDPVMEPAATEWIKMGLNPFYKRSNFLNKSPSDGS